jgi:hypothetical protein
MDEAKEEASKLPYAILLSLPRLPMLSIEKQQSTSKGLHHVARQVEGTLVTHAIEALMTVHAALDDPNSAIASEHQASALFYLQEALDAQRFADSTSAPSLQGLLDVELKNLEILSLEEEGLLGAYFKRAFLDSSKRTAGDFFSGEALAFMGNTLQWIPDDLKTNHPAAYARFERIVKNLKALQTTATQE